MNDPHVVGARPRRILFATIAILFGVMSAATPSHALDSAVIFTGGGVGPDGLTRAAEAVFTVSGDTLILTLKNTHAGDTMVPGELLSGIYFNAQNGGTTYALLTPIDVQITAGSGVFQAGAPWLFNGAPVTDVSGEFGFLKNDANLTAEFGTYYGVSNSGMDNLFGPPHLFDPLGNLEGPESPNGPNFGISSLGDNLGTGNGGVQQVPIINHSVTIRLAGASGLDAAWIQDVRFQYGTSKGQPFLTGSPSPVPEPGEWAAGALFTGMLFGGLALGRRRRRAASL